MKLTLLAILGLFAVYTSAHPTPEPSLGSFPEETPTCAVRCTNTVQVICAGPKTGCGKIKSFNNPCMLSGWNCNHKSHQYEKKFDGPCYPDDTIIGA